MREQRLRSFLWRNHFLVGSAAPSFQLGASLRRDGLGHRSDRRQVHIAGRGAAAAKRVYDLARRQCHWTANCPAKSGFFWVSVKYFMGRWRDGAGEHQFRSESQPGRALFESVPVPSQEDRLAFMRILLGWTSGSNRHPTDQSFTIITGHWTVEILSRVAFKSKDFLFLEINVGNTIELWWSRAKSSVSKCISTTNTFFKGF